MKSSEFSMRFKGICHLLEPTQVFSPGQEQLTVIGRVRELHGAREVFSGGTHGHLRAGK